MNFWKKQGAKPDLARVWQLFGLGPGTLLVVSLQGHRVEALFREPSGKLRGNFGEFGGGRGTFGEPSGNLRGTFGEFGGQGGGTFEESQSAGESEIEGFGGWRPTFSQNLAHSLEKWRNPAKTTIFWMYRPVFVLWQFFKFSSVPDTQKHKVRKGLGWKWPGHLHWVRQPHVRLVEASVEKHALALAKEPESSRLWATPVVEFKNPLCQSGSTLRRLSAHWQPLTARGSRSQVSMKTQIEQGEANQKHPSHG